MSRALSPVVVEYCRKCDSWYLQEETDDGTRVWRDVPREEAVSLKLIGLEVEELNGCTCCEYGGNTANPSYMLGKAW
jgi:hypothetical protein